MNEFLIGLKNGNGSQRATIHIKANDWFEAIYKALDSNGWAFTGEALAQNGQVFDRSGKFYI